MRITLGIQTILHIVFLTSPSSSDLLLFIFVVPPPLSFYRLPQDLLDSDWASVRKVLEQADILVIKYSVTDKLAFQQVRNGYAPRLRPLLRHWGVPVILVAVGARLNGEDALSVLRFFVFFASTAWRFLRRLVTVAQCRTMELEGARRPGVFSLLIR